MAHGMRGWILIGVVVLAVAGCRATARFDDAEQALVLAACCVTRRDPDRRAEVALRFAYLRANQGREGESLRLVEAFLAHARSLGGGELGRRLTDAGIMLNRFQQFCNTGVGAGF